MHMHFDDLVMMGAPPTMTREEEIHGAGVTGTHGMGVNTPRAAAVADATTGLAIDRHIPNGVMLSIGLLSMMLPTGGPCPKTRLIGSTFSGAGVRPMLHRSTLPPTKGLVTAGT